MSTPSEPVEMTGTSAGRSSVPSRMTAPFPYCFSIPVMTSAIALSFSFSMAPSVSWMRQSAYGPPRTNWVQSLYLARIMALRGPRYAPAKRLHELRTLLDSAQGVSLYEVAERFEVSTKTALRYLHALRSAGEPLYEEIVGRRKVWRLVAAARRQTITLSTTQ